MHINAKAHFGSLARLVLIAFAIDMEAQTLDTAEAIHHIGKEATVCGTIASERTASESRGKPTFVNLDKPYPSQIFTILVWGSDSGRVGKLPVTGRICATGTITEYRGVAEIVVRDSKNWFVPR